MIGCIADDLTGATDLAGLLVRGGLRVAQRLGVPAPDERLPAADAVVVALKTRSVPAADAAARSLDALDALRRAGATRFYFKYCSTFDSTERGNIGPVAEALMDALRVRQAVFCPAFPQNGRTVRGGLLYVHGRPLHRSGMERHPLNPMTDPDLVRVLGRQSARRVGLLPLADLERGPSIVDAPLVIADAETDADLDRLASALATAAFATGGSALAPALARAWGLARTSAIPAPPRIRGREAVLAGSRSDATRRQIEDFRGRHPDFSLDAAALLRGEPVAERALDWAAARLDAGPVLVHSSGPAAGPEAAAAVELAMGAVARGLVERGVRRLVVAGGETSGAVAGALGVSVLSVGPEIEPGVPWTETAGPLPLALALKSGNFGSEDFFHRALEMLR